MALRRSSPLQRRTGLQAHAALERRSGLAQVGRRRRETAEAEGRPVKPALSTKRRPTVPDDVRAALARRSGGVCEYPGCGQPATDPHHRKARKIGGRRGKAKLWTDQLANLIHLCRPDHEHVTRNVAEACDVGLIVPEYDEPADVPVHLRYGLVWLLNTGDHHTIQYRQSLPAAVYDLYQPKWTETRLGRARRWSSVAARLWSYVDVKDDPDACWVWMGSTGSKGYGNFGGGPTGFAHRLAYILHTGALVPPELVVMHSCDNPPCCNPRHLSVGTNADNSADMVAKGRSPDLRNERCGKTRLTNEQVTAIRRRWAAGESTTTLGREYGVTPSHLSRVVRGVRRPVEDGEAVDGVPVVTVERQRRDRDAVEALWAEAARMYEGGMTTTEIGKRIGQHPSNVSRRLRRHGVQMREGKRGYLPPVDRDEVRRLHAEGVRAAEMCRQLGIGRKYLYEIFDELSLGRFGPGSGRRPGTSADALEVGP